MSMKYSFHIGMCVCVTTCFLYVAGVDAATTSVQCCKVVAGQSGGCVASNAAACATVCASCFTGSIVIGGNEFTVNGDILYRDDMQAATGSTICYDKYDAQSANAGDCHANSYYTVTAPDAISATTCTYNNNNNVRIACYAGYYYYEPTDSCKPCPEGFTSNDKNMGGVGDCYRDPDESYENDMGYFSYSSACYCDEDCEDGVSPESSSC